MASNIPILQIGRHLIVPVQGDLHDQLVLELQSEILGRIERTGAAGLVLDISALEFVDSFMARVLNDIATMASLMGTRTVIVGMSPTIAIVLMDLGLQMTRVPTARNLEKGLALLQELTADQVDDEEAEEAYDD
jgi:rsbT antagonist protein RsbS